MSKKKHTTYTIEIEFNRQDPERQLYKGPIIYDIPSNLFDEAVITTHRIKIKCIRNRNGDIEQVLSDWNSTMNKQITKCIAFIAATQEEISEITRIDIQKVRGNTQTKTYSGNDISNPLATGKITSPLRFTDSDLLPLFQTEKSEVLMISLTFWVKAMSETEEGTRFEGLWRSYNALYNYISGKTSETEKLIYMRDFILTHKDKFPQTLSRIATLTRDDLRSLQWRNMIINNHDTESKTGQFADFILRNTDVRLIQIFQETLTLREKFLKRNYRKSGPRTQTLYQEVTAHLANSLTLNERHDDEVLSFLVNKYIYFIRNKLFHGEKVHPTFKVIKDYESKEIQKLNEIFSLFLYELILASGVY